jgi:hypothetical protein
MDHQFTKKYILAMRTPTLSVIAAGLAFLILIGITACDSKDKNADPRNADMPAAIARRASVALSEENTLMGKVCRAVCNCRIWLLRPKHSTLYTPMR